MPVFFAGPWNYLLCADTCETVIEICDMFFYDGVTQSCHVGILATGPGTNVTEFTPGEDYSYYTFL